jgi:hypothetical protein
VIPDHIGLVQEEAIVLFWKLGMQRVRGECTIRRCTSPRQATRHDATRHDTTRSISCRPERLPLPLSARLVLCDTPPSRPPPTDIRIRIPLVPGRSGVAASSKWVQVTCVQNSRSRRNPTPPTSPRAGHRIVASHILASPHPPHLSNYTIPLPQSSPPGRIFVSPNPHCDAQ